MISFLKELLPFAPQLLLRTEPLLKQNWTECDPIVILPIESTLPKVCSIFWDAQLFCNLQKHFLFTVYLKKYQQAIEKLGDVYFQGTTNNMSAIRNANIDLMSDLMFSYSIVKAAVKQTIANTKDTRPNSQHKNTFLFRFQIQLIWYLQNFNNKCLIMILYYIFFHCNSQIFR